MIYVLMNLHHRIIMALCDEERARKRFTYNNGIEENSADIVGKGPVVQRIGRLQYDPVYNKHDRH